jgi:hypothetical protein
VQDADDGDTATCVETLRPDGKGIGDRRRQGLSQQSVAHGPRSRGRPQIGRSQTLVPHTRASKKWLSPRAARAQSPEPVLQLPMRLRISRTSGSSFEVPRILRYSR